MSQKGKVDYSKGRIYIIKNNVNEKVYVGSTTWEVAKRFNKHVSQRNKATDTTWRFYAALNEIGPENFFWEEIEKFPCQNKSQLTSREGHWIRHFKSWKTDSGYNKKVEGRTRTEYYEDQIDTIKQNVKEYYQNNKNKIDEYKQQHYQEHAEHYKEYKQEWYSKHRESIQQKNKEKLTCTCGAMVCRAAMATHLKSKRHCDRLAIE